MDFMNGLLLLTLFCVGITVLTGGLLVFSLRRRLPRRTLALLSALVVLLAAGAAGLPEDVARAAMFFLSPDNGFVTGQMLYVCGGTTLGVAPI